MIDGSSVLIFLHVANRIVILTLEFFGALTALCNFQEHNLMCLSIGEMK
jgi:hypothetical protein